MAWARSELNLGALQNTDDVIQPKPVLPDFAVRQRWLASSFRLVN
jgi:hypothetical protein